MLSFSIIVFREVLEIALVLSILLAGTTTVIGRGKWIWTGIAIGVFGSVMLAFFTEELSNTLEGFGQEVFNGTVLILAATLIAFTVIWMKSHARGITQHLKEVGADVSSGRKPLYVLASIVALTFLREGSEVVLLAQGMLITQGATQIAIGGLCGLFLGILVGFGIYLGIIRSATKYIFEATSWLLIILCGGMVSQGISYLSSAEMVPTLVYPLWDTSHLLSEQSLIGQTLHVMFGYTARPSGMQVLCYFATITLLACALQIVGRKPFRRSQVAAVVLAVAGSLAIFTPDTSVAIDKIYSPIIEEGEIELETRGYYTFDEDDEKDGEYKQIFGLGYAFADRWAADIYARIAQEPNDNSDFDSFIGELRHQLFEQGEYWIDSGLYLEYKYAPDSGEHEIEGKLLLEKSFTKWVNTANIIAERGLYNGGEDDWEAGLSWHTLYRIAECFEPGIEIQSEFGEFDNMGSYNDQKHYVGPVSHGKIYDHFGYEIATLFGASQGASDFAIRWAIEYEI